VAIRGILKRTLAIAAVSALPLAGLTGPAHAADNLKICNSINSRGPIKVYSSNWPGGRTVIRDECNTFNDDDGSVRIDPDPELGGDVDSTWWGFIGEGYDYCDPGEGQINPPSYAPNGLRYNTDASGC
jgi:hypothetical protein